MKIYKPCNIIKLSPVQLS